MYPITLPLPYLVVTLNPTEASMTACKAFLFRYAWLDPCPLFFQSARKMWQSSLDLHPTRIPKPNDVAMASPIGNFECLCRICLNLILLSDNLQLQDTLLTSENAYYYQGFSLSSSQTFHFVGKLYPIKQ